MSTQLQRALAIHSAPALCGIKASNLINVDYSDDLFKEIEELNKKFTNFRFYILKKDKNKVLILTYRKRVLERELNRNSNKEFLKELGYDVSSIDSMLLCLKERIAYDDFPHEIGVFLGYDLSDIKSFIENKKCLYTGYWKVYSNLDEKLELFSKYTRCKNCVIKMIDKGFPIENFMK